MAWRTTPAADLDIERLAEQGSEAFGVARALRYLNELRDLFDLLAAHPYMARERAEIQPGLRVHGFRAHVVMYSVDSEDVLILRVMHAHQDWMGEF